MQWSNGYREAIEREDLPASYFGDQGRFDLGRERKLSQAAERHYSDYVIP